MKKLRKTGLVGSVKNGPKSCAKVTFCAEWNSWCCVQTVGNVWCETMVGSNFWCCGGGEEVGAIIVVVVKKSKLHVSKNTVAPLAATTQVPLLCVLTP